MQYEIKWPFEDSLGQCFHRVATTAFSQQLRIMQIC